MIKQFIVNQSFETLLKWCGGIAFAVWTGAVSPHDVMKNVRDQYHSINRQMEYAVSYIEYSVWTYVNPPPATYR